MKTTIEGPIEPTAPTYFVSRLVSLSGGWERTKSAIRGPNRFARVPPSRN